jgi:site-specific recombinase XerD
MKVEQIIEEFIQYLEHVRNYSPLTISNYASDLKIFYEFLDEDLEIYNLEDINDFSIIKFITYTKRELGNSPYASARKLRCLKSLFRYAIERNYIQVNPTATIREPRIEKSLPTYLTVSETKKLLNSIEGNFKERDLAIFMVFLFCGVRVSELSNIDISDIDFIEETLKVTGKGNKQRLIPLNDVVINSIEDYITVRPNSPSSALFLSYRKTRLSVRGIQKIVKDYVKKSGIKKDISPHKLRHTCATMLYDEGTLLELKELLGHESVATTQIYAHTNTDQLKKLTSRNPLLKELRDKEE